MRIQVTLAFALFPDADLIPKATFILVSMPNNPNFATPPPALTVFQPLIEGFQTALVAAADGGKLKTAEKNAAREALVEPLRSLARYVQQNCDNDLTKRLSSGFDPRKQPEPSGLLPAPQGVTLTPTGIHGEVSLRAGAVTNARAYEAQSCNDPGTSADWESQGTFSSARPATGFGASLFRRW